MTAREAMGWTVLLILTLMVCVGCAREVIRYQSIPLPLAPDPQLPTIARTELECLDEEVYSRLVYRELLIKQHRDSLRAVICTTRDDCPDEDDSASR